MSPSPSPTPPAAALISKPRRLRASLALVSGLGAVIAAATLAVRPGPLERQALAQGEAHIYLPFNGRHVELASLPPGRPVVPTATDAPTTSPEPSATPTSEEPEPTAPLQRVVHGRITAHGTPMAEGVGVFGPQIELRRQRGGTWETVAGAVTDAGGRFRFPELPLVAGETYQVWWRNEPDEGGIDFWLYRWQSRDIVVEEGTTEIDVGVFDVGDLILTSPCHDCLHTLPVDFRWRARSLPRETYHWALFKSCGQPERRTDSWWSAPLGRATHYTLDVPPPGFAYDQRYCWFLVIDDGASGIGWSYYERRITFCSSPATCR